MPKKRFRSEDIIHKLRYPHATSGDRNTTREQTRHQIR